MNKILTMPQLQKIYEETNDIKLHGQYFQEKARAGLIRGTFKIGNYWTVTTEDAEWIIKNYIPIDRRKNKKEKACVL